jgi:hypothetical protein
MKRLGMPIPGVLEMKKQGIIRNIDLKKKFQRSQHMPTKSKRDYENNKMFKYHLIKIL